MTDYGWGRIDSNGALEYCTNPLGFVGNPTDQQKRDAGFKPIIRHDAPAPREGGYFKKADPVDEGDGISIGWTLVAEERSDVHTKTPRKFSKLKLYAALTRAGLWDELVGWMETVDAGGINAYTAFMLANELSEEHPMFAEYLALAQTKLGVDDSTLESILSASMMEG